MNRLNPRGTALLASMLLLGSCGASGQTPPLRDPSYAQKPLTSHSATDPVVPDGLLSIDVVVTDAAGKPVANLAPWDFTLLDNGQRTKIRSLHNALEASQPVPKLIFVLDGVDLSSQQLAQAETAMVRLLRRNNGCMGDPCFLYRLTRDGLFSSLAFTRDGNVPAEEVTQRKSPRMVWRPVRNDGPNLLRAWTGGWRPDALCLRALGSIAIDQREIAGRKILVWVGPGWPPNIGEIDFDEATELSTRLREARITVDAVNAWQNSAQPVDHPPYVEAPRSAREMQPGKLALAAIAVQTGGLVLDAPGDLDREIERCVEAERSFYTLSFNPPHTNVVDDYHDIRVTVDRPGMTVRAPMAYYNEPVNLDNPRPGIEKVTVARLEDLVNAKADLPRRLENLELSERLSTARRDGLLSKISSERERQALTVDADLSIALPPPADEILNRPPPPMEEQRALLGRTFDYLRNVIPKLPNFYALRSTVRYQESAPRPEEIWKVPHPDQALHFGNEEHATVLYRDGREVDEATQKLGKHRVVDGVRARGLETRGTFGPILAYMLTAAATSPSTLSWKRWERGKYGDLAVFSYRVAGANNVPELSYCCLPEGDGKTLYHDKAHNFGEFALNPVTGAIMRIVINADLDEERDPDAPLTRSQIMVEYGPEELGGKTYICPQRSVEISRGRSERVLNEWGMYFILYSYFETMINDVTFGGYHKFGSEARILPGYEETEGPGASPPLRKQN